MTTYKITLTEEQLLILVMALELYQSLRMGRWWTFARTASYSLRLLNLNAEARASLENFMKWFEIEFKAQENSPTLFEKTTGMVHEIRRQLEHVYAQSNGFKHHVNYYYNNCASIQTDLEASYEHDS